jgi:hypothetical protein
LLEVTGTLAAPYGQLEIRPTADGLRAVGSGAVPTPIPVTSGGLDEAIEGRLASATGTVAAKPNKSSGGDLTIVLERPGSAPIKVVADASSLLAREAFTIGATYRVTGIVGQRATKKDAPDGYRLCPRDAGDLIAVAAATNLPGAGPSGASGAPGSPGAETYEGLVPEAGSAVAVSAALGRLDETLSIEGIVTAPATLLDSTGRRIVVQDGSAAIELLLPSGASAPAVGSRIRASGRVGVAYGAPRLRADELTVIGTGRLPSPLALRAAPGLQQEWRLVSITGRIDDVKKLGDRWRAELLVSGAKVVVVGQPGAGIVVTTLVEGRMASIVGIVRRPYPTAADQRFAITPRSPSDVRVYGAGATGAVSNDRGAGSAGTDGLGGSTGSSGAGAAGDFGAALAGVVDADLIDLAAFAGQRVRVGGLVVDLRSDGLLLDDGTTIGLIVVRGEATELLPLLEPDDAINAIGLVEQVQDGLAVVVEEPGGIIQAGDPVAQAAGTPESAGVPNLPQASAGSDAATRDAGFLDGSSGFGAGLAGLGTLIAFSVASLLVTLTRRVHARRQILARVAARVAAFEASSGPPPTPPSGPRLAERDDSTIHAA